MNKEIKQMGEESIKINYATEKDSKELWEWRNDIVTRQNSINEEEVSWGAHSKWFSNSLVNSDRTIFIASNKRKNEKFGMVRFDVSESKSTAEVSINLNPLWRGKRKSSIVLRNAIREFSKNITCVLTAEIKPNNKPSIRCFEDNNFAIYEKNHTLLLLKNKELIINKIEQIRANNNVNWMDLMRLAFRAAPKEAEDIFQRVNRDDSEINKYLNQLIE